MKRHIASFILAALLAVNVLAAVITSQATANESPDSGQAGSVAVTGNINTGHGSTTASAAGGGSQTKTCRWSAFQAVSGIIVGIKLKFDWSESGSVGTETNEFRVQYSVNGGGAWTNAMVHTDVNAANSGSTEVALTLPVTISQVQVRDDLLADSSISNGSVSVTGSISNIRLEVTTQDAQIVIMMD